MGTNWWSILDLGDHKTLHQKVSIRAYLGKRRGVVIGTWVWECGNDKDVSGKERRKERGRERRRERGRERHWE